ncbi:NUDIX hydrolase [Flavobacterium sp.]|uniref:NUDIX hydrolase n=1 Tax=Flavobacterium sp. TaxID=239 RepID=UPI00261DBCF1|nr:NUDIX hydrolase [Flavobacterium sp.]MDD2984753.1 NUDIX hydrolase [Flavobacterium sp.]
MIKISNNLTISAGLIIINSKKEILLIKPTGLEKGQFSLPKGIKNKNEDLKSAALRETKEEIGLEFNLNELGTQYVINYFNKDVLTKRCFCYLVKLNPEREGKLSFNYQQEEVEYCDFYSKEEANELIFWRYKELLKINDIWK